MNVSVSRKAVNIFSLYHQEENDFTNGLLALLRLSRAEDGCRDLIRRFTGLLEIPNQDRFETFEMQVSQRGDVPGSLSVPDAELSNIDCCLLMETKIVSGMLDRVQMDGHLEHLAARPQPIKLLVLLTPDDSNSRYIQQFLAVHGDRVRHLNWRVVFDLLDAVSKERPNSVFGMLAKDFVDRIRTRVFECDHIGIIQTLRFGESTEVFADRYVEQLRTGAFQHWNTPREYKQLSGTRRKLLLYDPQVQAITVAVTIERVVQHEAEVDFPWRNTIVPNSTHVFEPPLGRDAIRRVPGLERFARGQSAYRTLTHEQFRALVEGQKRPYSK